MEWIGSQICPASNPDWEEEDELKVDSTPAKQHDDSGNAMDASEALNGAAQILGETSSAARKKEAKRGGLNKLKSNKKMKEWWKEEYFAEMSSKRADRKLKTSKSEGGRWKRRLQTMHFDLGRRKVQIIRREEGASTRHDNALYAAAAAAAADSPSFKRVWKRKKKKKTCAKSEEDVFSRELSSTTSMRGTICYVAPEYGGCGYLMEKADIYSFGVLILVIVSGRRPLHVLASPMKLEQANLISWCRSLAQRGNVLELVDGRLKGEFDRDQASLCINLALMCLQKMPELRPDAGDIVRILRGEMELPNLPLECSPSPPSKLFSRSRRRGGEVG